MRPFYSKSLRTAALYYITQRKIKNKILRNFLGDLSKDERLTKIDLIETGNEYATRI